MSNQTQTRSVRGGAINDLRAIYDTIRLESSNSCTDAASTLDYFTKYRMVPLSQYEMDFIMALNFHAIREHEAFDQRTKGTTNDQDYYTHRRTTR